jgi:hypothetical protein
MEQKNMLLVYYKGVAPMELKIPAVQDRRKSSRYQAQASILLPIVTNLQMEYS